MAKAFRDCIVELRRVRASELQPNPANWRRHPDLQGRALSRLLDEIGYADCLLAYPTQKPVALFEAAIKNHLAAGQALYDPFLGSGTAIIAAEMVGVRAFGCEIEPHHADTCLARFEQATGKSVRRLDAV